MSFLKDPQHEAGFAIEFKRGFNEGIKAAQEFLTRKKRYADAKGLERKKHKLTVRDEDGYLPVRPLLDLEPIIWCDAHGCVHSRSRNPYMTAGTTRECDEDCWKELYVEDFDDA